MTERKSWDEFFVGLAAYYANERSKDPSTKVGAVIVRPDPDRTVAGLGYNGFPRKMSDAPELYLDRDEKLKRIIHAEINAKDTCTDQSIRGYTMYSTLHVCSRCFIECAQKGIIRFVSPKPTEEQFKRWEKSFMETWKYADEMGFLVWYPSSGLIEITKK